jgi:serine phosphatase RsbU (regulator of sigma subunit)/anti-sigma regulatory factor (Ser/Thr protein kinase)
VAPGGKPRWAGSTPVVLVYVAVLLLLTLLVGRQLPVTTLDHDDLLLLPALPLLVAAAEFFQVRYRIGGQVDGSNLIEAAIAPVIVIAPSMDGVAVVAAGLLIAAVVRRNSWIKALFNATQWSLATAVGAWVWTSFDVPPDSLTGATAVLLSILALGVVNLTAFSGVILLQGTDLRALRPMVGPGWLAGLSVNGLLGLLFVLADESTPYALILAPVPLVVLHLAYQGYAAARLDRSRLAGIHAAAQVLSDPLNPRSAIVPFLQAAARVFETESATLVLKGENGWDITRVHCETGAVETLVEPEDAASLEGALTAQLGPIRLREGDKGPLAAALRASGHRDCLAAPLHDGGKVLGALVLLDQDGMEGAPEGQLAVLEALAREVAAAFTRGWLLDSVFEERRKLATVVGATSDGIASIGEDGVVRSWNPALETITGLPERVMVGRAEALVRLDARTLEGMPLDLADWPSAKALPQELSVKALGGGRRRLSCSYSTAEDQDGRTLVVVARDVTPAQEFEALRAEFGRLVEQEAARRLVVEQLQAAVVPDTPQVPGLDLAVAYVASDPKEPTGGDLWDWHLMADGQLHIAVVDVLGHGVAATKSALSVVHTLRAVALDGTPLEDVVSRASALLERQDPDLVATVVLARLDPRTGRLRIASGGHPPALIVSSDGEVRQATATGGAIGWPGAGSDGVEEIVLETGDALLLYTDGLVEARKDILEGLESLARETSSVCHLPADALADELVSRALAGADRRDDTLALVVRRTAVPDDVVVGPSETGCWTIRPDRREAQLARREAVRWLADHGVRAGDVALVIAELLANAVRAARGAVVLEVSITDGRINVAVSDDGAGLDELPVDTLPPLEAEGSRGLFLVRKLSSGLELDNEALGTTVRCWLPVAEGTAS